MPRPPSNYATWLDYVVASISGRRWTSLGEVPLNEYAAAELAALRKKLEDQENKIERLRDACKAAYFYMPLATDTVEKSDCPICKDEWQSVISQLQDVISE